MKPPRKPRSRPIPGRPAARPARGSSPSPAERARRAAASWGVSADEPDDTARRKGKTSAPARATDRKAPPGAKSPRGGKAPGAPRSAARPTPDRAPWSENRTAGDQNADRPAPRGGSRAEARSDRPVRTPGRRTDRPDRTDENRDRPARMPRAGRPARTGDERPAPRPTRSAPGTETGRPGAPKTPGTARAIAKPRPADEPQRIAKLLARAGVASRREIERMIAEGRIALNGVALDTPATLLTTLNGVTVDGQPVAEAEGARLFLFHKPSGCLTTERDPAGRPTIYDRLPDDLPRLMPVGRLDMTTEGLLLLTNDGELKRRLELPSSGVERTYRARAFGTISQAALEDLIHGVEVDGVRYGRIDANLERRTGRNQWVEMTLTEGKNREVRRVLEYLGLAVNRLIRTRYGPFTLGGSEPGALAEIRREELESFLRALDRDKGNAL